MLVAKASDRLTQATHRPFTRHVFQSTPQERRFACKRVYRAGIPPQASPLRDPAAAAPVATQTTRLFSNLNPRTLQHDPGSGLGSALLVAGTTIGAGILALPAVTQDAGFVPSAATLTIVCLFSAATGLLIAEVNLKIMRERGAGGVSVITMARETLGEQGALASSVAYVFLHYALLVAYISKAGEIIEDASGLPLLAGAALFAGTLALLCYASSQQSLDRLNGVLVGAVVCSFLGLLGVAGSGVDVGSLVSGGDWAAVPATLPVVALAFVYHNVIPVISQALEGDVRKIRTAVVAGLAIPWLMFISWEGAILGSLGSVEATQAAPHPAAAGATVNTKQSVQASSQAPMGIPATLPKTLARRPAQQQQQQVTQLVDVPLSSAVILAPALSAAEDHFELLSPAKAVTGTGRLQLVSSKPQQQHQHQHQHQQQQQQQQCRQLESLEKLPVSLSISGSGVAPATSATLVSGAPLESTVSASAPMAQVADPLAALAAANPVAAPLIQAFSFLAIATSYIGFILGLTDFLADALKLPSGRQAPLPYLITVLPPFAVAVTNPDIFLQALDTAGTYGVLTLFGIQPAAMAWSTRYGSHSRAMEQQQQHVVPGGKILLLTIGSAAAGIIVNELVQLIAQ